MTCPATFTNALFLPWNFKILATWPLKFLELQLQYFLFGRFLDVQVQMMIHELILHVSILRKSLNFNKEIGPE